MTKLQSVLNALVPLLCVALLAWQLCLLATDWHTRVIIMQPEQVRTVNVRIGKHATTQQVIDAISEATMREIEE